MYSYVRFHFYINLKVWPSIFDMMISDRLSFVVFGNNYNISALNLCHVRADLEFRPFKLLFCSLSDTFFGCILWKRTVFSTTWNDTSFRQDTRKLQLFFCVLIWLNKTSNKSLLLWKVFRGQHFRKRSSFAVAVSVILEPIANRISGRLHDTRTTILN